MRSATCGASAATPAIVPERRVRNHGWPTTKSPATAVAPSWWGSAPRWPVTRSGRKLVAASKPVAQITAPMPALRRSSVQDPSGSGPARYGWSAGSFSAGGAALPVRSMLDCARGEARRGWSNTVNTLQERDIGGPGAPGSGADRRAPVPTGYPGDGVTAAQGSRHRPAVSVSRVQLTRADPRDTRSAGYEQIASSVPCRWR